MTDPTNARLRDFDIPVIMPRFAFLELPPAPVADHGADQTPVTTLTCAQPAAAPAAGATTVTTQIVTSKGVPPPVVKLGLPAKSHRRTSVFLRTGLAFAVSSDKKISDFEVRVVELLPHGRKRPLGVELVLAPGKGSAEVVVSPLPYAKSKLAGSSAHRLVRAIAIVTAQDGSVGEAHADLTLTG
jgi:hypothetical protein